MMMKPSDNVKKKYHSFLANLSKLSMNEPPSVQRDVRSFIVEVLAEPVTLRGMQRALHSTSRPGLMPFLKRVSSMGKEVVTEIINMPPARGGHSNPPPATGGHSKPPPATGGHSNPPPATGGHSIPPLARGGPSDTPMPVTAPAKVPSAAGSMFGGYRVSVDMSALFDDQRASGALWMYPERCQRPVADLEDAIVQGWGLQGAVRLMVKDMLLPRQEPAFIVQPADVIKVMPEPAHWATHAGAGAGHADTHTALVHHDDVDGSIPPREQTSNEQTRGDEQEEEAVKLRDEWNDTITDHSNEPATQHPHAAANDASNNQHVINELNDMQWSQSHVAPVNNSTSVPNTTPIMNNTATSVSVPKRQHLVFDDDCSMIMDSDGHDHPLLLTAPNDTQLDNPVDGYTHTDTGNTNSTNETASSQTLVEAKRRALQLLGGGVMKAKARRRRVRRRPKASRVTSESALADTSQSAVLAPSDVALRSVDDNDSATAPPTPMPPTLPTPAPAPANGDTVDVTSARVRAASESRAPRLIHAI